MKYKLTPLNIVVAILLTAIAYLLLFPDENGWRQLGTVPLFVLLLICLLSDIVFRLFVKDLKRIWIVEICFLIFAFVLIIILKR